MSLRVAAVLNGLIDAVLLPMSRRQKQKTKARLSAELQRQGAGELVTERGTLKFMPLRGAGAASAFETFHADEPETRAWIERYIKPGETMWDIGASIGMYALYAALDPKVKVVAFEPSALNFSLLVEHIALNNMGERVTPVCAALSGHTKLDTLYMSRYDTGSAGNALGVPQDHRGDGFTPLFAQGVPAFTGDDFCATFKLNPPDHIKLDVDGIEGDILRGMSHILPRVSSVLLEVEGLNADHTGERIDPPFTAAGFAEDTSVRSSGTGRNRLYINKNKLPLRQAA